MDGLGCHRAAALGDQVHYGRQGGGRSEYRSSILRLTCAGPRTVRVDYVRGLASFEIGTPTAVTLLSGDKRFSLARIAGITGATSDQSEVQSGSLPFTFFESAQHADAIILSEADERATGKDARQIRLSTGGLSRALGALQPHCGDAGRGA